MAVQRHAPGALNHDSAPGRNTKQKCRACPLQPRVRREQMPRGTSHGIYSPPELVNKLRGGPTPPGDAWNLLSLQPPGGRPDAGVAELEAAGRTLLARATTALRPCRSESS
jgi:hypothetical protein